ncbi:MAG: hypothetical protein L0323_16635 [Planctomycetes bacterium]|nr:hypothetical protein [Planctomycetota bacterium]
MEKNATEPRPLRVMLVVLGTLIGVTPFLLLAGWAKGQAPPIAAACSIPAGVLTIVAVGAIGEWLVHRCAMHGGRRFPLFRLATDLHHRAHHWVHFTPDRYVHAGRIEYPSPFGRGRAGPCRTPSGRALTVASHGAFYTLFAAPIVIAGRTVTANAWFTASAAAASVALIGLFIRVHDAVHYPGASRMERFRWFWFLDRHHYIHHIDNGANTNFLLPLGDLLMGTLRLRLTPAEQGRWPSYEEARRRLFDPASRATSAGVGGVPARPRRGRERVQSGARTEA